MFGWGKKAREKKEAEIAAREQALSAAFFPACCFTIIANDAALVGEALAIAEARAGNITGVASIETKTNGNEISITLLVDPQSDHAKDPELVFYSARAAGLGIAGELRELGAVSIAHLARGGEIIATYPINPPQIEDPIIAQQGLLDGLAKSSSKLAEGVASIFTKAKLDNETLDELEELLIMSDMGVEAASRIRASLATNRFGKDIDEVGIKEEVAASIAASLQPFETNTDPWVGGTSPRVIMFVGVNGSGKTTTIGKIAQNLVDNGQMLCAADTFRAAASEQLIVWGQRAGVPVVSAASGADAAGLAFDALTRAKAEGVDVLLVDTAGRLQNKTELMAELGKIVRVLGKIDASAPHEVWLVLDATVGQNALSQAEVFSKVAGVTGLIMTKLDGTAKGGVLVALSTAFGFPIRFIGVGEGVGDLRPFSAEAFAKALVGVG
ncbi:MAG: fused signal recognition particle receptor [Hyphomonadaceae bacterium]|nr:MAG: fused signal recognition particle receptor [Hyphomonadaceae bacterium]